MKTFARGLGKAESAEIKVDQGSLSGLSTGSLVFARVRVMIQHHET